MPCTNVVLEFLENIIELDEYSEEASIEHNNSQVRNSNFPNKERCRSIYKTNLIKYNR